MTIHRPEPIPYDNIEVELVKKPGKGLGLGVMARTPSPGVYISDLVSIYIKTLSLIHTSFTSSINIQVIPTLMKVER